jgi:hypothetical protein
LRFASAEADRALERAHLGGQILDLCARAGTRALQRDRAIEPRAGLVALRLRPANVGDRGLDVGASLVGVEPHQHVAGLDLLAFLKFRSWMMPETLAVTMMASKARTVPTPRGFR